MIKLKRNITFRMCSLHRCDNRTCCNPSHLWEGTYLQNHQDMIRKGRGPTGDKSGPRKHPETRPRGEEHYFAKLSTKQVLAIRSEFAKGGISKCALGRKYGVTSVTIYQIVTGMIWKHISVHGSQPE